MKNVLQKKYNTQVPMMTSFRERIGNSVIVSKLFH